MGRRVGAAEIFAQIGRSTFRPAHMEWASFLSGVQFRHRLQAATVVIAHAGIGTLLMAQQAQKPMIVMPRRVSLKEGRNDHQLATRKWLCQQPGVIVVDDANELDEALRRGNWPTGQALRAEASPELLATVRAFIEDDPR
jgi:UDP-N-acetylglucosamine transferase subunit ALG13